MEVVLMENGPIGDRLAVLQGDRRQKILSLAIICSAAIIRLVVS